MYKIFSNFFCPCLLWEGSCRVCEWRWLKDRAEFCSRWTWLQMRLSELDSQIQQLGKLRQQILSNKVKKLYSIYRLGGKFGHAISTVGQNSEFKNWSSFNSCENLNWIGNVQRMVNWKLKKKLMNCRLVTVTQQMNFISPNSPNINVVTKHKQWHHKVCLTLFLTNMWNNLKK